MMSISNESPVHEGRAGPAIHLIWECRQLLDHSDGACQWHVTGLEIIERLGPFAQKPGRKLFSFCCGPQVSLLFFLYSLGPGDTPWVVQTVLSLGPCTSDLHLCCAWTQILTGPRAAVKAWAEVWSPWQMLSISCYFQNTNSKINC